MFNVDLHPLVGQFNEFNLDRFQASLDQILDVEISKHFVMALVISLNRCMDFLKLHFEAFLPGGHFFENPAQYESLLKSSPTSNNGCESVFGFYDFLQQSRPNMSYFRKETMILIRKNKTIAFLKSLDQEKQDGLIEECKKKHKDYLKAFRKEMDTLQVDRLEKMRLERLEREEKEIKEGARAESLTNLLLAKGLWITKEQVQEKLSEISDVNEQLAELTTQLKFRKQVIKQNEPNSFFTTSERGKKLPVVDLKMKLEKLVGLDYKLQEIVDQYVGQRFKHRFQINDEANADKFEVGEDEKNANIMWGVYFGTVQKAVQAKPSTSVVYFLKYDAYNDIYPILKEELEKDIIEEIIEFE